MSSLKWYIFLFKLWNIFNTELVVWSQTFKNYLFIASVFHWHFVLRWYWILHELAHFTPTRWFGQNFACTLDILLAFGKNYFFIKCKFIDQLSLAISHKVRCIYKVIYMQMKAISASINFSKICLYFFI